ncbi:MULTISPECIES: pyridoxine/pyridoxal/pyridoxamine kinase [Planococcus]|uniref:pyridoxal kinase n=1 Tax=Planococcus faecalis TaxID=1598147 RepID=A0ABM6IUW9_9BACL|nr:MULTISPECIES: pyridoxine/pyridoxal/pyridoxamine kinase [Planococcus]AQU80362.1 bifunctional hydroxymethylpyrimidine kinase/phosphomethylpyrimidine kinase [Planococcus faecalis]KAA0958885.1 pyridoxine/pyridoxal/pyridoxamine kinase [Planococcus sp. ANT_H30]MDJ0330341.1 pyridoxine/pyridoxal/pyridoxamine kinase [Planococcus sp. S3-L1]OHX55026.1 bifunctional hydroxymethylpyrimidine kinase/phosphomethylpyrimidine kinase [Planococcus faecalis]
MTLKKTLTIAGSDTSGGAGIQADLKTFQEHGTYGMNALTVIVTMDPENGWSHGIHPIALDTLDAQLKTAFSTGVDALKTGMLPTVDIIEMAGKAIADSGIKDVVIDPVMACKGENEVLFPENVDAMIKYLLPNAKVVTPNLVEAGNLSGMGVLKTVEDMQAAAEKIHAHGAEFVVIKGGKQLQHEKAADLLFDGKTHYLLTSEKTDTTYNHGAGCTFAAAITANLANGQSVKDAVLNAKFFVATAIQHGWKLNEYVGPVMHGAASKFTKPEVIVTEL